MILSKKSSPKAVFVAGGGNFGISFPSFEIEKMFRDRGDDYVIVNKPAQADIIVFIGGDDISPSLYGEFPLQQCGIPDFNRDEKELLLYALTKNKLKVGICRGAQFLCVANKHKLWQHVDGHSRPHKVMAPTLSNQPFSVTSTHHQMMRLVEGGNDYEILAWAFDPGTENRHLSKRKACTEKGIENSDITTTDPEIVWFNGTKTLCVQGHPEYEIPSMLSHGYDENSVFREHFFDLLERKYDECVDL